MSARQDAKAALAALLDTALVGTGLPVEAVYGYKPADFAGQSPVVVVDVAGTMHPPAEGYGAWPAVVNVNLYVFSLYSEQGTTYTNEDAEEQLADIEQRISDVVRANRTTTTWSDVSYRGASVVGTITLGGNTYKFEEIPLALRVG
jgi:hypothetical protein